MRKTFTPVLGMLLAAGVIAAIGGCDDKKGATGAGATEASSAAATTTTAAAAPSSAPSAAPSAVEVATASPSGSAVAAPGEAPKVYDCGAKGQKPCPMQGWMKTNMAGAVAANDADKLATALTTIAGKAPPGMASWSSIATAGAAKAKAGDIDGAKVSCKQCHDAFKETYKKTMRDRPF